VGYCYWLPPQAPRTRAPAGVRLENLNDVEETPIDAAYVGCEAVQAGSVLVTGTRSWVVTAP
jgi:hypothetical protein